MPNDFNSDEEYEESLLVPLGQSHSSYGFFSHSDNNADRTFNHSSEDSFSDSSEDSFSDSFEDSSSDSSDEDDEDNFYENNQGGADIHRNNPAYYLGLLEHAYWCVDDQADSCVDDCCSACSCDRCCSEVMPTSMVCFGSALTVGGVAGCVVADFVPLTQTGVSALCGYWCKLCCMTMGSAEAVTFLPYLLLIAGCYAFNIGCSGWDGKLNGTQYLNAPPNSLCRWDMVWCTAFRCTVFRAPIAQDHYEAIADPDLALPLNAG